MYGGKGKNVLLHIADCTFSSVAHCKPRTALFPRYFIFRLSQSRGMKSKLHSPLSCLYHLSTQTILLSKMDTPLIKLSQQCQKIIQIQLIRTLILPLFHIHHLFYYLIGSLYFLLHACCLGIMMSIIVECTMCSHIFI